MTSKELDKINNTVQKKNQKGIRAPRELEVSLENALNSDKAVKITLESLLNREIEEDKIKEYDSEQLGGIIEFKRINPEKIQDILGQINDGLTQFKAYQWIIYLSCPLFQNEALLKKYSPPEPYEVVYPVLNKSLAEINEMGNLILEWYGFKTDIKK